MLTDDDRAIFARLKDQPARRRVNEANDYETMSACVKASCRVIPATRVTIEVNQNASAYDAAEYLLNAG